MGYRHINNLYKDQTVLMFKQLYAMEKIHGTSANISFKYQECQLTPPNTELARNYTIKYFSGGEKQDRFIELFNEEDLIKRALNLNINSSLTVYGEAYGGKQQGMSETYGKELKFIAFEVAINDNFVDVKFAHEICEKLGLDFVHYEIIDADPNLIDKLANAPSVQAKRNGVENPKLPREGIVLRPLREFKHPDGVGRIMAKHKNDIYKEREHAPKIKSPEESKVLEDAKAIAQEWVTPMRLNHVLDKLKANEIILDERAFNKVIKAMIEDVERESEGEIIKSKVARKAIGKQTSKLYNQYLKDKIK